MQDLHGIRNVSIIAHIDAGKTSTTEAMLFYSGLTHRIGSIDEGTTVMDYLPEERARGITITAAAASLPWLDHLVHLIDTPGHIDFTAEVERSLRVIDGAVVIFSGVEGVEAQSEKVWRQADHYRVPRLAFINKLDRVGACFDRVVDEIQTKFGDLVLVVTAPVGIEDGFRGVIDLRSMELVTFLGDDHETVHREPIPPDLLAEARPRREALIERLADFSDDIATLFLGGEEVPRDLVEGAIRQATRAGRLVPVFAGSAKKRLGVQLLMDGVVLYLPSPADVGPVAAYRVKDDQPVEVLPEAAAPFTGLVFKVVASTSADLLYVRTYSGTLRAGATLANARTKEKVRTRQLLRLYAKNTEAVESVGPGDIIGVIGPKDTGTGDTICEAHRLVAFERIAFPDPVISVAVEPRLNREKERVDEALGLLCREDPTLSLGKDEETGQRIFAGMGELHLEINLNRLAKEFNVEVRAGEPRVAYRETFRTEGSIDANFDKVLGETTLYAGISVAFRPLGRREELFQVGSRPRLASGEQVHKGLLAVAEKAVRDALRTGGGHGYPLIYVAAEITDLRTHPERTTEPAVVGAALMAVDHAIRQLGTSVLEPLMHLEIVSPEQTVGEISTYLQPRRAVIHSMTGTGGVKRIACEVPLAEMFGFGKALPKLSGGRATFSMEPCGYQELPPDVAKRLFGIV